MAFNQIFNCFHLLLYLPIYTGINSITILNYNIYPVSIGGQLGQFGTIAVEFVLEMEESKLLMEWFYN